jgi:starch-binding outer membrane protein, SusD/RagB family
VLIPLSFRNSNSKGTSGEVGWLPNMPRLWEEKNYFYPVPEAHLPTNPKLA